MNRTQPSGFTLIELLIVIAIIAILSTTVVMRFARPEAQAEMDFALSTLEADVRKTLTWTQAGKIDPSTGQVPDGYGIVFRLDTSQYEVWAEYSGDTSYSGVPDVIIETRDLQEDVLVDNVRFTQCEPQPFALGPPPPPPPQDCQIFFQYPGNDIYTLQGIGVDTVISVTHTVSGDTVLFTINGQTGQTSRI